MCATVDGHKQDDLFSNTPTAPVFTGRVSLAEVSSQASAIQGLPPTPEDEPAQSSLVGPEVELADHAPPVEVSPKRKRGRPRKSQTSPSKSGKPKAQIQNAKPQEPAAHLTVQDVARHFSVSVPTIWRWRTENPDFPKGLKLSPGTTRWFREDIERFDACLREITR